MEIKIAHCADVHFGIKGLSNKRRAEIKSSFFKMLDKISEEDVELFLIAGDLFDNLEVNDLEVKEIKTALENLKCKTVIAPGNHDPFIPDSLYYYDWPKNVYIFKKNTIEFFEIPEIKTRIWGSAFTHFNNSSGARISSDDKEKISDGKFINILLAHGTYPATEPDQYNPITAEEIRESGMNYIALGHIHKRTPVQQIGQSFYAYPGCHDGKSFKEMGEKGFYLGCISDLGCKLDFIRLSTREYLEINIDITGLEISDEIIGATKEKMEQQFGKNYKDNIYRIILEGEREDNFFVDSEYIGAKLKEMVFFAEVYDKTIPKYKENGINIKSVFIKNMREKIKNCQNEKEKECAKMALHFGIKSFKEEITFNED